MSTSRFTRGVTAAASIAALTLAGSGTAASAQEPEIAADVFLVPLSGSAVFEALGTLTFSGEVQVVIPGDPITPVSLPTDPVRVITALRNVVGTGDGVSCDAIGADTFPAFPGDIDIIPTGTYNLLPGDPVAPQDSACADLQIAVQYQINFDAFGNVIDVDSATVTNVP